MSTGCGSGATITRRDTIIELARTLRDMEPCVSDSAPKDTGGRPGFDSGMLQHPVDYYRGSYRQLEDALTVMRVSERLHRPWWHFTSRYVASIRKPVRAKAKGRTIWVMQETGWQPVTSGFEIVGGMFNDSEGHHWVMVEWWHENVQPGQVNEALDWLDGNLPSRLYLPDGV